MKKFFSSLILLTLIACAIIVSWPSLLGLQRHYFFAQAVSSRGFLVGISAVILVVLIVLAMLIKPWRSFIGSLSIIVILFAGFNAFLAFNYGVDTTKIQNFSVRTDNNQLTVLAWNTMGDEPGADEIAKLAIQHDAKIVSLPETTLATTNKVAKLMAQSGMEMQTFHRALNQSAAAKSTGLLVSTDLGLYTMNDAIGDTSTLPTLIVENGSGSRIVAVHTVAPMKPLMEEWKRDLYFLSKICSGPDTVMVGDFNATLDHFLGLGSNGAELGQCFDAAKQAEAAGLGTWPTNLPPVVAFPIDRVMATKNWHTDDFWVVDSLDDTGSDHRPVIAKLSPAE